MSYFVYIVECNDGTYYTGSTDDVARRIKAHNEGKTGAKYTKPRRPVRLIYKEACKDKGAALSREAAIKRLSKMGKRALIKAVN